jgi:hypothetical protein
VGAQALRGGLCKEHAKLENFISLKMISSARASCLASDQGRAARFAMQRTDPRDPPVSASTGLSLLLVHDVNTLAPQIQRVAASTRFLLNKRPRVERIIFFIVVFYLIDILW